VLDGEDAVRTDDPRKVAASATNATVLDVDSFAGFSSTNGSLLPLPTLVQTTNQFPRVEKSSPTEFVRSKTTGTSMQSSSNLSQLTNPPGQVDDTPSISASSKGSGSD
jgi:hypothetical protein